jgi:hypothetical protein
MKCILFHFIFSYFLSRRKYIIIIFTNPCSSLYLLKTILTPKSFSNKKLHAISEWYICTLKNNQPFQKLILTYLTIHFTFYWYYFTSIWTLFATKGVLAKVSKLVNVEESKNYFLLNFNFKLKDIFFNVQI